MGQQNIHYFPGHMSKALDAMQGYVKSVDLIVEIVDGRAPLSSRNPLLKGLAGQKPILLLLSKSDYADPAVTEGWIQYFASQGQDAISGNLKKDRFVSLLSKAAEPLVSKKREKEKKRGMMPPAIDVEFYGIYNEKHPEHVKVYEVLDVMLELLEKRYDRKPIIYTNSYIYSSYISGRYDDYPVWISDPEISDTLPDGRDWLFCQYTFRGVSENIAGGEKYVDLNVFNGSEWEFRKYSDR